jgi:4-hydroxy-tetrahydrodipicolinate reductase
MKIALLGYGKMGKAIEQVIDEQNLAGKGNRLEVVLRIDESNRATLTPEVLAQADVAIEFSTPHTAYNNILLCFDANVPVVVGTTGWLDKLPELKNRCLKEGKTLFYASNYSIGVNIFFEINRRLAELMDGRTEYNVLVEEIHHTEKLDAPSGTAISLANDMLEKLHQKQRWVNHATEVDAELPIISVREDKVPGTHEVRYQSTVDTIEIKHTAHSRMGFARGAVMAAEWVAHKKGCFGMKDLLGI